MEPQVTNEAHRQVLPWRPRPRLCVQLCTLSRGGGGAGGGAVSSLDPQLTEAGKFSQRCGTVSTTNELN